MVIKEITIDHYDRLISFWKDNYFVSEMDNRDRFNLFLDKNPNLSIFAEDNGEIVGTALGSFDGRRGYIQKVVTKKDLRQRGIGKQLTEDLLQRLKALGVIYIPIAVEMETTSFYEKCGFKISDSTAMNISFSNDKAYEEYSRNKK